MIKWVSFGCELVLFTSCLFPLILPFPHLVTFWHSRHWFGTIDSTKIVRMSKSSEETTVELTEIHVQLEEMRWQLKESQTNLLTLQEQLPAEAVKCQWNFLERNRCHTLHNATRNYLHFPWTEIGIVDSPMARVEDFLEDLRSHVGKEDGNPTVSGLLDVQLGQASEERDPAAQFLNMERP